MQKEEGREKIPDTELRMKRRKQQTKGRRTRRKEKEKGHVPTGDPATKGNNRSERAADRRRNLKQGETEEATGVMKNGE